MKDRNFRAMLEAKWAEGKFVCVGLDPDWDKIPESVKVTGKNKALPKMMGDETEETLVEFCSRIAEATHHLVCAYKPNVAFFEAMGIYGIKALERIVRVLHQIASDIPVILDAKRADIGNTNAGYVKAAFELLGADAITVHPYLGREALQPFLDCRDKGVIVLCRTSNPGAGEFQDLTVHVDHEELLHLREVGTTPWSSGVGGEWTSFSNHVAYQISKHWDKNGNCAIVAGATSPSELESIRRIVGDLPILIPGVGFQQKGVPLETQVEQVVTAGQDSRGRGMIINSSRGIIFASSGEDFAEAARRETEKLHILIDKYRKQLNLPLAEERSG